MLEQYLPIALMMVIGVVFGYVMLKLNEWLGPRRPTEEKVTTYESGMDPVRTARERFSVKFYLVAMLFIVFDIEVVFLYPWAVSFRDLGVLGFVSMTIFILVLVVGYVYVWRRGAIEWD